VTLGYILLVTFLQVSFQKESKKKFSKLVDEHRPENSKKRKPYPLFR